MALEVLEEEHEVDVCRRGYIHHDLRITFQEFIGEGSNDSDPSDELHRYHEQSTMDKEESLDGIPECPIVYMGVEPGMKKNISGQYRVTVQDASELD